MHELSIQIFTEVAFVYYCIYEWERKKKRMYVCVADTQVIGTLLLCR